MSDETNTPPAPRDGAATFSAWRLCYGSGCPFCPATLRPSHIGGHYCATCGAAWDAEAVLVVVPQQDRVLRAIPRATPPREAEGVSEADARQMLADYRIAIRAYDRTVKETPDSVVATSHRVQEARAVQHAALDRIIAALRARPEATREPMRCDCSIGHDDPAPARAGATPTTDALLIAIASWLTYWKAQMPDAAHDALTDILTKAGTP